MAVATDVFWNARNLHRQGQLVGGQAGQQLVDAGAVFDDQGALGAALFGLAKDVEGRATQAFHLGQQAKGVAHPGAVGLFHQFALLVLGGRQGRRQVVHQLEVALKLRGDLVHERLVGVQTGHFVLVLVRHELEQVAGHGLGQAGGGAQLGLGGLHLLHKGLVVGGVGGVLVAGEEVHALGDHVGQGGLLHELDHLCRLEQCLHGGQVVGAAAAPFKGGLVVFHLHAVEFHGAHQRGQGQRHAALLPGVAQQQRVGVDAVAQQLRGHLFGVKTAHAAFAQGAGDGRVAMRVGELPVGVVHERRGGRAVRVQRHEGAAGLQHGQRGLVGGHDGVAANH